MILAAAMAVAAPGPEGGAVRDAADAATPQAQIQARRAGLKKMGKAMKALIDELKTEAPDRAGMLAAAESISTGAEQLPRWFPPARAPRRAKPTRCLTSGRIARSSTPSRFSWPRESRDLVTALQGGDMAAIRERTKALGAVCSSCHKSFRAD